MIRTFNTYEMKILFLFWFLNKLTFRFIAIIIQIEIIIMNRDLETFNYFVDDLLSLDVNLLEYELDILLMQHLFNSINLAELKDIVIHEDISIAS